MVAQVKTIQPLCYNEFLKIILNNFSNPIRNLITVNVFLSLSRHDDAQGPHFCKICVQTQLPYLVGTLDGI